MISMALAMPIPSSASASVSASALLMSTWVLASITSAGISPDWACAASGSPRVMPKANNMARQEEEKNRPVKIPFIVIMMNSLFSMFVSKCRVSPCSSPAALMTLAKIWECAMQSGRNLLQAHSRIGGTGDGPSDHQVVAASGNGILGGNDTLLVAGGVGSVAYPRCHQHELFAQLGTQRFRLCSRAHHAIHATVAGQAGQPSYLLLRVDCDTRFGQVLDRHTGQHRHGDQQRTMGGCLHCRTGRLHHGAATGGVYVDHPHAQFTGGGDCLANRVGNVMKLQIQKHVEALARHLFHEGRTGSGEQLLADLDPAAGRIEPCQQGLGGRRLREIQSHHNAFAVRLLSCHYALLNPSGHYSRDR